MKHRQQQDGKSFKHQKDGSGPGRACNYGGEHRPRDRGIEECSSTVGQRLKQSDRENKLNESGIVIAAHERPKDRILISGIEQPVDFAWRGKKL